MSAARKTQTEDSTAASKAPADINSLQKRLAELLETEIPGSRVSFGFTVLSCVAQGQYDRALTELERVCDGLEDYALFEFRARRFIEHAKSLVITIKAKHTVGKSSSVNKSKQKELADKITEHFVDLRRTVITIEKIQKSVRSSDLSTTVYFLKTSFFCVVAIFVAAGLQRVFPELMALSIDDVVGFSQWLIPWLK